MGELAPFLAGLVARARDAGIGLTVDTEEADRLYITLYMFGVVFAASGSEATSGAGAWDGFGIAVQAYQKRAPYVVDWLVALAKAHRCRIPLRLVKGVYWDSEIKRAQALGLDSYPVYSR